MHGGVVERDEAGEPTGILREESAWRFRDRYVLTTKDEWVEATRAGIKLAASRGVGAIHDKDGWLGAPGIFQRLRDEGNLSLRVWGSIPHEQLDAAGALSLRSGFGDEYLRIGYLKCFMDGTLGSQTALLTDGTGVEITSRAELEEIIRRGAERGWPVGVHAIGDQANRNALDAFEATRDAWAAARSPPPDRARAVPDARRISPASPSSGSPARCSSRTRRPTATSPTGSGRSRLDGTYSFRSLLESGALVANGSDAPVEELDPIAGIAAGVLRSIDGRPAWRPEEALTVEQALHATCVAPTFLSGDERRRGRLLPGMLADLVVLDRDPLAVEPEELRDLEVVATMVGGRWTHNAPPWD